MADTRVHWFKSYMVHWSKSYMKDILPARPSARDDRVSCIQVQETRARCLTGWKIFQ